MVRTQRQLARTYGVIAVTNYVLILTATIILIDRLVRFLEMKNCVMTGEVLWPNKQLFTEESALRHLLHANYAWWKAPSPAFAHSKHTDMMWSAAFEAIDGLDNRGTWEEVTSGPISLAWPSLLRPDCTFLAIEGVLPSSSKRETKQTSVIQRWLLQ